MKRRAFIYLLVLMMVLTPILPAWALSRSDTVTLQKRLSELGFSIGEADGVIGSKTSAAVKTAQQILSEAGYDIEVNGTADEMTVRLIMDNSNTDLLLTLIPGSSGPRVKELQQRLVDLNLLSGSIDGIFGQDTVSAVSNFENWASGKCLPGMICDQKVSVTEYSLIMSDLSRYGFIAPVFFDPAHPDSLEPGHLYAAHAVLMDAYTGDILFEKDADTPAEPASTTKIITLITALSLLDPDSAVEIPACALDVPEDSSLVPVLPGERMTARDLLYALMLRSGNDAANAVAELSAGSIPLFVEKMNETATSLGMTHTSFVNPHGYQAEGHLTTARDLAIAARYGLTLPEFWNIALCRQYILPATENRPELKLENKYEVFDPTSEWYIPHAFGIKSGYTSAAGFCYAGTYQENGTTLIAVVLGGRTRNQAWSDLRKLFACGMAGR